MNHLGNWQVVAALAVLLFNTTNVRAGSISPLPPRPHLVGCSNITQDFARMASGTTPQDYWEGNPNGGSRYITDLLVDPVDTFTVNLVVPNDGGLYGPYVNQTYPYVFLVCYPTSAEQRDSP